VALGASAPHGLGAAGNAVWRVQRLVSPSPATSWHDVVLLGASVGMMAVGLLVVAADTAAAVPVLLAPSFCPI
jgi:hypothetical protein